MKVIALTCILIAFVLTACGPALEVGMTRCNGDVVEIYGANGQWSVKADCAQIPSSQGESWTCCALGSSSELDGGLSMCHPASLCETVE